MSPVPRYSMERTEDGAKHWMEPDADGGWVEYAEYAALLQAVTGPENQPNQFGRTLPSSNQRLIDWVERLVSLVQLDNGASDEDMPNLALLKRQLSAETTTEPEFVSIGWQYKFPSSWGGDVWLDSANTYNGHSYTESREIFARRAPKTAAPLCPTCKTELAFEGDVCGLCP